MLADGHCGFGAVAHCLGRGQYLFIAVQQQIYQEIQKRREFYKRDPAVDNLEEVESALIVTSTQPCGESKWMSMPSMAAAIANAFETPLFFFSTSYSHTAFPHFCAPNNKPPIIIALIGILRNFVVLQMKKPTLFPAPQPLRNRLWQSLSSNEALDWPQRYVGCFQMMEDATNQNSVVVDLT